MHCHLQSYSRPAGNPAIVSHAHVIAGDGPRSAGGVMRGACRNLQPDSHGAVVGKRNRHAGAELSRRDVGMQLPGIEQEVPEHAPRFVRRRRGE